MILTLNTDHIQDAAFAVAQGYTYFGGLTFLIVCLIVCYRWEEDISKDLVHNHWSRILFLCIFTFPVVQYWLWRFVLWPLLVRTVRSKFNCK